jgi:hypothetical protein
MAQNWVSFLRLLQGFDFVFGEADVQRFDCLIQVRHLAGPDNGFEGCNSIAAESV